jgi:hypothetical protein
MEQAGRTRGGLRRLTAMEAQAVGAVGLKHHLEPLLMASLRRTAGIKRMVIVYLLRRFLGFFQAPVVDCLSRLRHVSQSAVVHYLHVGQARSVGVNSHMNRLKFQDWSLFRSKSTIF